MTDKNAHTKHKLFSNENGNVLFIVLMAIVLIGALTAALRGTTQSNANIDNETLIIRAAEIKSHANEIERAILFIMQEGKSEADIRFSHPDAPTDYGDLESDTDQTDQVFSPTGGAATYRAPPDGVNDTSQWEFYGHTALPNTGSDAAELIAVLPNVTQSFCDLINRNAGFSAQPRDTGTCINGGASVRFDDGTQFDTTPNTVATGTFSVTPVSQACIECINNGSLHYIYVLMTR